MCCPTSDTSAAGCRSVWRECLPKAFASCRPTRDTARAGATGTVDALVPGAGLEPARGLSPEGFSYHCGFRGCALWSGAFVVWTFSLPCRLLIRDLGRGRQVSTLSPAPGRYGSGRPGLSSGSPPPSRAEVSPNLTPFTLAVSGPGAQYLQVPCVYQFRHPGNMGALLRAVMPPGRGAACANASGF